MKHHTQHIKSIRTAEYITLITETAATITYFIISII